MSKGSTVVPVRIPPALLAAIDAHVERSKTARRGEPFNRSSFILAAVFEKLRHYERSNGGRSTAPLSADQIRTAEAHRQEAYEAGFAWACDCPECEAARRITEGV